MASIDWGMISLGALVGIGCRKQLKSCGRVAAKTAASLAGVAAQAAADVAKETAEKQAPEQQAAEALFRRIDQHIAEQFDEFTKPQAGQNGQNNSQNPNG